MCVGGGEVGVGALHMNLASCQPEKYYPPTRKHGKGSLARTHMHKHVSTRARQGKPHAFLPRFCDVHELCDACFASRVVARNNEVLLRNSQRLFAQRRVSQLFDLRIKAVYDVQ